MTVYSQRSTVILPVHGNFMPCLKRYTCKYTRWKDEKVAARRNIEIPVYRKETLGPFRAQCMVGNCIGAMNRVSCIVVEITVVQHFFLRTCTLYKILTSHVRASKMSLSGADRLEILL